MVRSAKVFGFYSVNQKQIFEKRYPTKRCHLLGMSVKDYGEPSPKVKRYSNGVHLLFFGRIESYKGLDILINAIHKVNVYLNNKIYLSIYGKGSYWEKCKCLITNKEFFNLNIRYVENVELPNLMKQHHYLALPYKDSTQSGPIMIAARYGMPVFCTDMPGFRSVYNDMTGVFFNLNDIEKALCKISNYDVRKYNQYLIECKKLVLEYSEERIYQNYKAIFSEILQ